MKKEKDTLYCRKTESIAESKPFWPKRQNIIKDNPTNMPFSPIICEEETQYLNFHFCQGKRFQLLSHPQLQRDNITKQADAHVFQLL